MPDEVRNAVDRFFRLPNLIALRELALRRMTSRVEAAARESLAHDRTSREWLAREQLLVAVGPDEQAEQLVRAGKRMADALSADWTVLYVETPWLQRLSEKERNRRIDVLRLAESLGAETVTLDGPTAGATIAEYAQTRKATRVLVGAPKRRGLRALLRRSTATDLQRRAHGFDVVTIALADRRTDAGGTAGRVALTQTGDPSRSRRYTWAAAISIACTALAWVMDPYFESANIVMVYLLGTTIAGLRLGRRPSVLTTVLNVLFFDFFFVPPRFHFAVSDAQYVVTFGVMLTIGLVIGTLMSSVRQQTRVAGARERRTALLYAMSRELAGTRDSASMARVAVKHVAEVFECRATVLFSNASGKLEYPRERPMEGSFRGADLAVAQWVADHGRRAGLGSDTLPAAPALYLPLDTGRETLGVLAVLPSNRRRVLLPEQRHLLETFAGQIALAVERARLAEAAEGARVAAEAESLRNTLLASISHDLRTPLAVMAGAGSTLATRGASLDEATRLALAHSIETKAREMSELVSNVLDLTRLDAGEVALRREPEHLDELVGAALHQYEGRLAEHPVEVRIPNDLPALFVDAPLVVQVFGNLFDNAAKYTPRGTHIQVSAANDGPFVRVTVDDDGPGLPPGDPSELFEKFRRGEREATVVGAGLGLAICRAIVRAHGGTIEARRRPERGTRFEFTLPIAEPRA
jgi:two-component system sensor histidine kinase KdpD